MLLKCALAISSGDRPQFSIKERAKIWAILIGQFINPSFYGKFLKFIDTEENNIFDENTNTNKFYRIDLL